MREVRMYLKENELPLRGKVFGWGVVAIGAAIAFWIVCDAIGRLG